MAKMKTYRDQKTMRNKDRLRANRPAYYLYDRFRDKYHKQTFRTIGRAIDQCYKLNRETPDDEEVASKWTVRPYGPQEDKAQRKKENAEECRKDREYCRPMKLDSTLEVSHVDSDDGTWSAVCEQWEDDDGGAEGEIMTTIHWNPPGSYSPNPMRFDLPGAVTPEMVGHVVNAILRGIRYGKTEALAKCQSDILNGLGLSVVKSPVDENERVVTVKA